MLAKAVFRQWEADGKPLDFTPDSKALYQEMIDMNTEHEDREKNQEAIKFGKTEEL